MIRSVSRSNMALSAASVAVVMIGVVAILRPFSDASLVGLVRLCMVFGVVLHLAGLSLGSGPIIGAAVAALALGGTLAVVDDPSPGVMVLCLAVGCLWYVAAEVAWEAIDRRDGLVRDRSASVMRIREVGTVCAVALVVGIVAIAGSATPPTRSLPLQALAVLSVCMAAVGAARRLGAYLSTKR